MVSALSNCCQSLCKSHTPTQRTPWHADRRSARGWQSQTQGEIFKGTDGACADPGTQNFPCHGAAVPPPILIQLTFTSHTGSLLLSSLKKVTSPLRPPPLVPRPLLGTAAGIGKTVETFLCIYAVLYCEKVTLYPHFRDNLRGKVVDNLDNKVGITFTIHSGFPPLK